jgi:tetratricopeptide (TPR) repeat protein
MCNRSFMFIGTIILLLLSTAAFADDSGWRVCHTQAGALCRTGEWSQAFQQANTALNMAGTKYGQDHLNTAKSLERLGEICVARGRLQQADLIFSKALKIRTKIHGDCHPSVIKLLTIMADHQRLRLHRECDSAEKLYRKALDLADRGHWGESSYAAPALEGLARLYMDRGDYASAEPLYQKAISMYETGGKYRSSEKLGEARNSVCLAEIKRAKKDFPKARELYETALVRYLKVAGPTSPMIAFTYKRLADLYSDWHKPTRALAYYQRSLGAYENTGLPEGPLTAATLAAAANVVKSQGKLTTATGLYEAAQTVYDRNGGLDRELATMALTKARVWPLLSEK